MFRSILVPPDWSPLSRKAEDAAIEFACRNGAGLVAISVATPALDAATAGASFPGCDGDRSIRTSGSCPRTACKTWSIGQRPLAFLASPAWQISYQPCEEILKAASDFHCDVIFMASHGRRGLKVILLGSETQKVLSHAHLPVGIPLALWC
jgi:hypothetical protein